jgi:hypothetical protein
MNSPVFLRAHTTVSNQSNASEWKRTEKEVPKWPESALIFDCETRIDEKQTLTFGWYRVCCRRLDTGTYDDVREEGVFYDANELNRSEVRKLKKYAKLTKAETANDVPSKIQIRTREEFLRVVLFPLALSGTLIVGFNLPFDISRIAADAREARRLNDDWSFVMLDEPFAPRIIVTRKDGKIAFFRMSGVRRNPLTGEKVRVPQGRFVDLRTLAWALRNVSYSLATACEEFQVPGKLGHAPSGKVTPAEIEYARQDVRATAGLFNALSLELDKYPVNLYPDRAYSPASVAKAYFDAMGLRPPSGKFRLSSKFQGIAAQTFYGGRAEARIRRTPVPAVLLDFKSEYPTGITLMGLWGVLTAEKIEIKLETVALRKLLKGVTLDRAFDSKFWKRLMGFALVQPDKDILPVRTEYNSDSGESNVGVNLLTSSKPIWYTYFDLVSSMLLTGKPAKVISAFRIIPRGRQAGLKPSFLGCTKIDPCADEFFKVAIETRERVKSDQQIPEYDREALGYFLKIVANAGYGVFIETTPKQAGDGLRLQVSSGELQFQTGSKIVEDKGSWYCPFVASLITASGRLLLAMAECAVREKGGSYVFADTDSMAIAATKSGDLVPCEGGSHRLPDGCEAINAVSWDEVREIATRFNLLNPYDRNVVPNILKVEDVNYENGSQREIIAFAVSAKRYTFFSQYSDDLQIIKPSEHGLGHLFVPMAEFDKRAGAKSWIVESWSYLIRRFLGLANREPDCFEIPAMMKFAITTPNIFKSLQKRQLVETPLYSQRMKPFNFILCPMLNRQVCAVNSRTEKMMRLGYPTSADTNHFTLIAPFTDRIFRWFKMRWINIHDGRCFYLAPLSKKQSFEAAPLTLGDVIRSYDSHPESKSVAPDGTPCGPDTTGLLKRTHVIAGTFGYVGKETDRRWEHEEDLSMLFPTLPVYRPDETENLVRDSALQVKLLGVLSIRAMAQKSGLSTRTVRAARSNKRIRKETARKLQTALAKHKFDQPEKEEECA